MALIVWGGTGSHQESLPIVKWLEANNVDGRDVPIETPISVRDGQIHYTRYARTLDGHSFMLDEAGNPVPEQCTAPVVVAWPQEVTA